MTTITDPEALPSADGDAAPSARGLADGAALAGGHPFAGTSDRTAPVFDPATGRVTKQRRAGLTGRTPTR